MKPVILILFLLSTLAAGCRPQTTPDLPTSPAPAASASPQGTSATTAPLPTQPPATVSATIPQVTSPIPAATAKTAPTASLVVPVFSGTQIAPDCASFPGFPTCGKGLPLSGRLALYDAARQTARIYDFGTKLAIEVKAGPATRIEWLDQGNYLVTYDSSGKAALAWANPVLSKMVLLPPLSPDGTPVFIAADGSTAWLDTKFAFHVLLAGSTKEQVWPAEAQASDKIHQLLGWVPGSPLLLAGYHFSGNSMWVTGNRLYTLDARSGEVKEMTANLQLGGAFRWHPSQAGLLLYGDSNGTPANGAPRLAVLDVNSGKAAYLISDELVTSSYPTWMPDGKAAIHAARKAASLTKADNPSVLTGIFLTSYPAGTSRRLTQPATGERDDWPQLLTDGKHFLYLRSAGEDKPVELRLGSIDGSLDGQVASGLSPAPTAPNGVHWEGLIAYAP